MVVGEFENDVEIAVVVQVLTDAGQSMYGVDAGGGEVRRVADTRKLQQLGRTEGAARDREF